MPGKSPPIWRCSKRNIAAGVSRRTQPRHAARRAIGSVAHAADLHRDARSFAWLDDLQRDLRHAVRMLARSPGFTAVALLTLGLGIGATTAVFSVVNGVLLTPLPYPEPDRLVRVFGPPPTIAGIDGPPSRLIDLPSQTYETLRLTDRAFSHVAGYLPITLTMTGQGEAVRLVGSQVSAAVFPMLGIRPLIGRTFEPNEEATGADAVVVLSEAAWRRYFNADEAAIGKVIALDGRGRMVIGVMPAGFSQSGMHFPDPQAQFWVPYVPPPPDSRNRLGVAVMARLAPGVSLPVAEDVVNGAVGEPGQGRFELSRVHDEIVRPVKPALLILSGAVGLVLLIACVNVANLLLARTATREREIAVRRAVGAARGRLIRQLLAESALLSLVGGLLGTIVALGGVSVLRLLATSLNRRDLTRGANLPRLDQIGIDGSVLAFTIGVCSLRRAAVRPRPGHPAVAPARCGSAARKAGESSHSRHAGRRRDRDGCHAARRRCAADPQLPAVGDGRARIRGDERSDVPGGAAGYISRRRDGFRRSPGRAPGLVARRDRRGIFEQSAVDSTGVFPRRQPAPSASGHASTTPLSEPARVSPGFFEALGLRLLEGRMFSPGEAGRREALVSRTFARSGFFDGPALGRPIYAGKSSWEVVGIVEDIRQFGLDQPPGSEMFILDFVSAPPGFGGTYFAVRTEGAPLAIGAHVRTIVRELDSSATVNNVATMEQIVSNAVSGPRLYAVLLGTFAAVAVALAAIGIYGVLAFIVTHRAREIGIRMALGARPAAVVSLVVRQSAVHVVIGVIAGIGGAALLSRYLQGLLFGVAPLDPLTFAAAGSSFTLVALGAAYRPARRAAQVDPVVALRAE